MQFDTVLIGPRKDAMRAAGHWRDVVLSEYLDRWSAQMPDKPAVIAHSLDREDVHRISYGELGKLADRVALALIECGIDKGDVVSFQLPNWWEFTVLHLACLRIGAVSNPVMPIFRQRELSFMLDFAETKLFVVPKSFRGFDYPAMVDDIRASLPHLKRVLVVGGDGEDSFEQVAIDRPLEEDEAALAALRARKLTGDDVVQLLYTSGTTGEPKGVMHTSNTLLSILFPFAERLGLEQDAVIHMPSPLAHQLGFMYGLMLPVMLGATVVLQDVFTADAMADQIIGENASFTMAATPFLNDLTEFVDSSGKATPSLGAFVSAGAPIPSALVSKGRAVLDANIISAWGMTENGVVTMTCPGDGEEKTTNTDGCALPGMEARIVDANGGGVATGEEGQLQVRGCSNFAGYLKRPNLNNTDDEGWFDTGDLARMDADGYIRISGRSKDIVIRGGENVPVVEIEGLLFKHPALSGVAIVGYPDQRLGERACAFVTLREGKEFSLPEMAAYLESEGVAKQYMPERLEVVDDLPRTPSGKIQKFKLRETAQAFAG